MNDPDLPAGNDGVPPSRIFHFVMGWGHITRIPWSLMIVLLFSTSQFGGSRLWVSNKVDVQILELFQGGDEGAWGGEWLVTRTTSLVDNNEALIHRG